MAGVAGTAGSNEESRKSLRIRSASTGEFDGRLKAGLEGLSINGVGRLRALPLGLAAACKRRCCEFGALE